MDFPDHVGRRAAVEGVVYRKDDLPAGTFVLFRFVINCCAADAFPAGLLVACDRAGSQPVDSWVRVRGVVETRKVKGAVMPVLRAERVVRISPPWNPYIEQRPEMRR